MLGVKRMPRPLSESRKPESRRKIAVSRGMRLRQIDSPLSFPGQPCEMVEGQAERIAAAQKVANPGCYPTGAIGLWRPLVITHDYSVAINAISGYSGRCRQIISAPQSKGGPAFVVSGV